MNDFYKWLYTEMDRAGINQSELAALAGIARSTLSMAIKDDRPVSAENVIKIAQALSANPVVALQKAGYLIDTSNPRNIAEETAVYKLADLTEDQIDRVIEFIEFIQDRDEKRPVKYKSNRSTREGETPPEVVK